MSKSKTYLSPVQPLWINDYFKEGIARYDARNSTKHLEEAFEDIARKTFEEECLELYEAFENLAD